MRKLLRKIFGSPCSWGFHKERELSHFYGNGLMTNNITGNAHPIPAIMTFQICERCSDKSLKIEADGCEKVVRGRELELALYCYNKTFPEIA